MKKKYIIIFVILISIIVLMVIFGYSFYKKIYHPNTAITQKTYLFIPTGANFNQVLDSINTNKILQNEASFIWVAKQKKYIQKIRAGRYAIEPGMSNNTIVNLLRAGLQEPIRITFNNLRYTHQIAGRISKRLEADSLKFMQLLMQDSLLQDVGLNTETALLLFLPNTYDLYWNTSSEAFLQRMKKEFNNYWNESRRTKAQKLGLSIAEVGILASIVQSETRKPDEMPRVAGVYLNRIKRGMLLQADPTLVFAFGDFSIKRVLNRHKTIDSPYNTYKYAGLPPGPIVMPDIITLEQVLQAEQHDYLYFCAREDFSGYHNFSKTLQQHNKYARIYQQRLNQLNIMR